MYNATYNNSRPMLVLSYAFMYYLVTFHYS